MYRSGSTFLYNMVKELKKYHNKQEWKLHKVHEGWLSWLGPNELGEDRPKGTQDVSIYSYRDVRDVIASFCYRDNMNFETFSIHGRKAIPFIEWIIDYDQKIKNLIQCYSILNLKYEDCILGNPISTYNAVSGVLGVSQLYNIELSEQLCLEKQKEKIQGLKDADTNTLYWPNHIKDGRSNKYKDIFTDEEIKLINSNQYIKNYLKNNGYEI
ncbi:unnamed protein product [marine sediment metagenome]|uniref:Sulfotransferase domain-containing protein n=1 Tax=marine sediment metagenome TaxID=412755 RepID=X0VTP5_9ZZZZ